jgi:cytochrome c553
VLFGLLNVYPALTRMGLGGPCQRGSNPVGTERETGGRDAVNGGIGCVLRLTATGQKGGKQSFATSGPTFRTDDEADISPNRTEAGTSRCLLDAQRQPSRKVSDDRTTETPQMARGLVLTASLILCGLAAWADSRATDTPAREPEETAASAQEVDLEAAQRIYQRSCRACHGNRAQGASSYPSLSDKEPEYIVEKLERYRAGERFGPNSILMIQHARKLSDGDIASLAVFVATTFD